MIQQGLAPKPVDVTPERGNELLKIYVVFFSRSSISPTFSNSPRMPRTLISSFAFSGIMCVIELSK